MTHRVYNVLFLCTGNSARSILAEAAVNHLSACRERFCGYSAGSQPRGEVHPLTLELLGLKHIPVAGLRSKSWDEFAGQDAPALDFVFTVCDQAAGEPCPYWPGRPVTAHWGMPDPAQAEGSHEQKLRAFADTFHVLQRRIELFASLPLDALDRLSLERRLQDIART